jgi:fumarate hydratase class II
VEGQFDGEFVVDVFQTGSGTSTNMNANEVIAARATEILGGARGDRLVHPNDHVNMGQSSNDVIPTAIHLAALIEIEGKLEPALDNLRSALASKAKEFWPVIKTGCTTCRTQPRSAWDRALAAAGQVAHGSCASSMCRLS